MNNRIEEILKLTLNGNMWVKTVPTHFDRKDIFLSRQKMESKRLCEYIMNQEPKITEFSKMTGFFRCDGSIVGDAFKRGGHKFSKELFDNFYVKPIDDLSTQEWQHATADYQKLLNKGIKGLIEEVDESLKVHIKEEEIEYLNALKLVGETLIAWAHKCSKRVLEFSKTVENQEYKVNLIKLSEALLKVPENKPENFYQAVLSIYVCFSADPDSLGTLDRYLRPFYFEDLKKGILTREEASEYLQELFMMIQAATPATSYNFTRGGESHFCVGGYLADGTDGFDEFSKLILESLVDLPMWIPQVSLRWTEKLSKEDFKYVLDLERKDPNKRIAFQNDEKRVKAYMEICGFPFEKAVNYTTVGCNEPAFLGAISGSNSKVNFLKSTSTLFHEKSDKIKNVKTFDEYYEIFLEETFKDLEIAYDYDDLYNAVKAKDINYLSGLFFQGCIEKAKSLTQGSADYVIATPMYMGITNVIDSLIIVKQFVFDEKIITMAELIDALKNDWVGYEDLHTLILNKGDFFGNDTERSNYIAQKLYRSLYEFLKDKTNLFGYHWLIGDLTGYNVHFKIFGEMLGATPDGRKKGQPLKFGLGQGEGKDREGLSAFLNSVAKVDPSGIGCGATVTNITVDEQLIKDDVLFEKTVDMLETYFKMGGVHFQLTYVSKEDLKKAKITPEEYKNLRVRVSGFSEYFVSLNDGLQDDIIRRTEQK